MVNIKGIKGLFIKKIAEKIDAEYSNSQDEKDKITIAAIDDFVLYTKEGVPNRTAYNMVLDKLEVSSTSKEKEKINWYSYLLVLFLFVFSYLGILLDKKLIFILLELFFFAGYFVFLYFKNKNNVFAIRNETALVYISTLLTVLYQNIEYSSKIYVFIPYLMLIPFLYFAFVKPKIIDGIISFLLANLTIFLMSNAMFYNSTFSMLVIVIMYVALMVLLAYLTIKEIDFKWSLYIKAVITLLVLGLLALEFTVFSNTIHLYFFYIILAISGIYFIYLIINKKAYVRHSVFYLSIFAVLLVFVRAIQTSFTDSILPDKVIFSFVLMIISFMPMILNLIDKKLSSIKNH